VNESQEKKEVKKLAGKMKEALRTMLGPKTPGMGGTVAVLAEVSRCHLAVR
jgi:hypothetical protein